MHPSNLVLYSSGVLHLRLSPWETGIMEREILGHHFTNIPNKILFSNRAPSKWSWGKVIRSLLGTVYTIFFNCELWNRKLLWLQLLSTAIKWTPHQNNEGGMSAHTRLCARVPIVPSQKENGLLTFQRSSHQCLISFWGEWMLIIASTLKPYWEFHIKGKGWGWGEGTF